MQVKFLSKKEIDEIENILKRNYQCSKIFKDFDVFKTSKQKIWILTKGVKNLMKNLEANMAGLYFGELKRNKKIKLSIEGAQIVGKTAKKNVVIISKNDLKKFFQGYNVKPRKLFSCEVNNFCIVKCNKIVGVGILRKNEGYEIENSLPKARRIVH